jgi:peptidyl-prolyl cis-trans isomerase C
MSSQLTHRALALSLALVPALVGCGRKEAPAGPARVGETRLTADEKGQVVAKVGDTVFTLEDVEQRINQQSPFARSRFESLARKKEFLDSMVRFELLADAARAKGYDQDPDVVLARKQAMVAKLTANELAKLVTPEDITDAEIEAWYTEHADQYSQPATVRAAHLVLADEAEARALLAELQAGLAELPPETRGATALARFSAATRERSTDKRTAPSGGDLGYFSAPGDARSERAPFEPEVSAAVANAAFAVTEIGGLAPEPVRSNQGWHLVQKTAERKGFKRSLDEVRTRIRNALYRSRKAQAADKYVSDLRAAAKVEIDDAVLDRVKVEPPGTLDPRIVPGPMREALGGPTVVRPPLPAGHPDGPPLHRPPVEAPSAPTERVAP